ncbi:hypothetical protein EMIHUDRAFT_452380 [Emiliania huxleyi CCMP1516]|uniref:Peptidase S54 rhomboid domain-containing protein n=2 Tax=Emiliania huxleyi TaxID=2903 RepID=A0A0D3IJZ2_EMIH1|nr:hypothetical protein EMIHUDRAFT_452380 [Emiliania huxleyi CCMP1516]EOD11577.1 hypothetical protein EMIHUDRAFT_452380 [Emiliania huxleyi CCMP1516]|eukprot:XP_005764006.1 hypothetical protein EMIHUDRAFT_452380 [Emiliania huxleyi CCMP1516]
MFFWLPVTLAPAWSRRVGTIGSAVESRPAEWVGHICGGAALATLRTAHPRLELGFQLDASAAVGPALVLGGFAALQVRGALGLRDSQPEQGARGSLLPSGSRRATVKDVLIGGALVLQICWFLLSLTDPLGGGGSQGGFLNRALSAGGEWVDQREAQRAAVDAEYRAMLQAERTATDAPPACATRKLDDPLGGCAGEAPLPKADPEFSRTRGLDATRGWISGSAANPSGL